MNLNYVLLTYFNINFILKKVFKKRQNKKMLRLKHFFIYSKFKRDVSFLLSNPITISSSIKITGTPICFISISSFLAVGSVLTFLSIKSTFFSFKKSLAATQYGHVSLEYIITDTGNG